MNELIANNSVVMGSDTVIMSSKVASATENFLPPKKRKRPDEVIVTTHSREELLMKDCGKLMHRTVDTTINKAKQTRDESQSVPITRVDIILTGSTQP